MKEKDNEINDSIDLNRSLEKFTLEDLIKKADELLDNTNPYSVSNKMEQIKSLFYKKINNKKNKLVSLKKEEYKEKKDSIEEDFNNTWRNYREKKKVFRKNKEKEENKNLITKKEIIKEIQEITEGTESISKTFKEFRKLQQRWKETGNVPIINNRDLWNSYHHNIERFYDFIRLNNDLRDLDFKRNLEEKNKICENAESLLKESSLNNMHEKLQKLHEHWRDIGPVKKELRKEIWERFQKISRKLNKKRNDYFIIKKKENKDKLLRKNNLAEEIIKIAQEEKDTHQKWEEATKKCKKLESEWKKIGKIGSSDNKEAWKNIRNSLKLFYKKKKNFYEKRKIVHSQILEKQKAIYEKVEKIKNNTNWKETEKKIIILQKQWSSTGYTSFRKESEIIWKKFIKSCNTFFVNKRNHVKKINEQQKKNLKDKKIIIQKLKKIKLSSKETDNIKLLKEISDQWEKIENIIKDKNKVNQEFYTLLNKKYKESQLNKEDLEKQLYINKVKSLKDDTKKISHENNKMRNQIDLIKKEINQYKNNITFLSSNKNTKPLVKKVSDKIEESSKKIEKIKEKIKILKKG